MPSVSARALLLAAVSTTGSLGLLVAGGGATFGDSPGDGPGSGQPAPADHGGSPTLQVSVLLSGASLQHQFTAAGATGPTSEPLTKPDDITRLGDHLFVGFQNGVGPQGEASSDGNLNSTIVEVTMSGQVVNQWDIVGKADGVTADRQTHTILATVNEDNNSALYSIDPSSPSPAGAVTRYAYNGAPPHGGGTDAISIYRGQVLISASAPGTTGLPAPQPTDPAVYSVTLNPSTLVATVAPLFGDEATGQNANFGSAQFGQPTTLALTDPDSNEVVPFSAPRFGGDFMLTAQGDQQQVYVDDAGRPGQHLSVLSLSQAVDDTAWTTDRWGRLFSADSSNDAIDVLTGPFRDDQPLAVATPCGSNGAPATCPAPPTFPANYLATINPWTGQVSPVAVAGAAYAPQGGLVFVPGSGRSDFDQ
jgi:hypothetical protein